MNRLAFSSVLRMLGLDMDMADIGINAEIAEKFGPVAVLVVGHGAFNGAPKALEAGERGL